MSTLRKPEIAKQFTEWLDRYAPPQHLRDKKQAAQAEFNALVNVLLKMAPQAGYMAFVRAVTEKLDFTMKVRTWPSVHDLAAACSNVHKETLRPKDLTAGDDNHLSSGAINARLMMSGKAVGEHCLYGEQALELLDMGLVTQEVLERYRNGAYRARASSYGTEAADRWRAEMEERHQAALTIPRQRLGRA